MEERKRLSHLPPAVTRETAKIDHSDIHEIERPTETARAAWPLSQRGLQYFLERGKSHLCSLTGSWA